MKKLILDVIYGEKNDRVPIWIMRQAGRYLPQYRKLRRKYDFLSMCLTPELAAEITLQPVETLDVDAAIIFSDILIPCLSMGCMVEFIEGKGPVFHSPVRSLEDIRSLKIASQNKELDCIFKTLTIVKKELPHRKTLIGFCAAPFTLACYLVEGGTPKNFLHIKTLLYDKPDAYSTLMEKITQTLITFLKVQAKSGADILQIFDTWGGILSPSDFKKFSLPYLEELMFEFKKECNQPLVYFMRGSGGFLSILKNLSVEVMGIDWTVDLLEASKRLGERFVLQGNLDPAILLSGKSTIREKAVEILRQGEKIKGHIFNLGHGILPSTPVENARYLVEVVHNFSPK
ncbi:MAG: uroporphyrinogen decarboxylase [Candidatus Aminicenantales bacterium]